MKYIKTSGKPGYAYGRRPSLAGLLLTGRGIFTIAGSGDTVMTAGRSLMNQRSWAEIRRSGGERGCSSVGRSARGRNKMRSCPHTLTFRTTRITSPMTKETAAIPKLIASISANRVRKGRSFATEM